MKNIIHHLRSTKAQIVIIGMHRALIQSMIDFDYLLGEEKPRVRYIITSNRNSEKFFFGNVEVLIPCITHIKDIAPRERRSITCMVNVQSGRRAALSTKIFFEYCKKAVVGVIFAEGIPEAVATDLIKGFEGKVLLLGPASVGLLIGGVIKLGAIGGVTPEQLGAMHGVEEGTVAVVSTSGGMTNELIHTVVRSGQRVSFALSIGGDRFPTTPLSEVIQMVEADKKTKALVYFGELGGVDEYEIIDALKEGRCTKPVIAYIAGTIDEAFTERQQFGHAKALAQTREESARAKRAALKKAGAYAPDHITEIETKLRKILPEYRAVSVPGVAAISPARHHSLFSTRELQRKKTAKNESYTLTRTFLYALLGHEVQDTTAALMETIFKILVDHGGHVSGAVNSMIAARAGKDIVSSLASGILTVGPRFGGAINNAAAQWLTAVEEGEPPENFVERHARAGIMLSGIGHKKYRIGLPDPRVAEVARFAAKLKEHRYLDFARQVEAITTEKSGSLILNVDGVVAAVVLDVLKEVEGYDLWTLKKLLDQEFFNALFVIPRSVGLLGHILEQKHNDEGLFRLPDDLLFTHE